MANDIITNFKVKDENGVEKNAKVCYESGIANKPTFKTINGESIVGSGNIVVEGGSAATGNTIVDLTDYVDGDTLLPEVVEALKDEKALVLYKLPDSSKILLTTRFTYGQAAPDEYIQYRYTYAEIENNLLRSGVLEVNTINYAFRFYSEYEEFETVSTVNDKLSRKMGLIDLSSFSDGDTLLLGTINAIKALGDQCLIKWGGMLFHTHYIDEEVYQLYASEVSSEEQYLRNGSMSINLNTRLFNVEDFGEYYISQELEALENNIDKKILDSERTTSNRLSEKMTVIDLTGKVENDVLSQYDYNEIAADPERVMLLVDDPEGNTANPVLMGYFGEDTNYYWFLGYYTTRAGDIPSNSLYSFFLRVVKSNSNRKLIFDYVKKYDLSSLSPRKIDYIDPYEEADTYENTNNQDTYIFNFNDNGMYRIRNYSTDFAPEGQNVQLRFNFGFGKQYTDTGRYISKESLDILKEVFPDYDSFSFGMEGQESCFIAYPPAIDKTLYFKVTDNEVEVFIGREE